MPKYIVNPGKCVSIDGEPRVAGTVVTIDDVDAANRLVQLGEITEEFQAAPEATEAQKAIASFKANPKAKPAANGEIPTDADAAVDALLGK